MTKWTPEEDELLEREARRQSTVPQAVLPTFLSSLCLRLNSYAWKNR